MVFTSKTRLKYLINLLDLCRLLVKEGVLDDHMMALLSKAANIYEKAPGRVRFETTLEALVGPEVFNAQGKLRSVEEIAAHLASLDQEQRDILLGHWAEFDAGKDFLPRVDEDEDEDENWSDEEEEDEEEEGGGGRRRRRRPRRARKTARTGATTTPGSARGRAFVTPPPAAASARTSGRLAARQAPGGGGAGGVFNDLGAELAKMKAMQKELEGTTKASKAAVQAAEKRLADAVAAVKDSNAALDAFKKEWAATSEKIEQEEADAVAKATAEAAKKAKDEMLAELAKVFGVQLGGEQLADGMESASVFEALRAHLKKEAATAAAAAVKDSNAALDALKEGLEGEAVTGRGQGGGGGGGGEEGGGAGGGEGEGDGEDQGDAWDARCVGDRLGGEVGGARQA